MDARTESQSDPGERYIVYEEEVIAIAVQTTPLAAPAAPIEAKATPIEAKATPIEAQTPQPAAQVAPIEAQAAPIEAQVIPIEGESTPAGESAVVPLTVVGSFDGPQHAEQVLLELKEAGFTPDQVSMVTRASREIIPVAGEEEAIRDGEIGAAGVGLLGGVAGWLLGISALALPGIGPIVGIGILWTTLVGAGIGAAAGGLGGALVGHGVDEAHAREYEEQVRQGRNLVTVHANDRAQQQHAREILDRVGGTDVRVYGEATA